MAAKKHKLDIFQTLEAMDKRDYDYFNRLSDEEKKAFAGIVIMRWMSSVKTNNVELQKWHLLTTNGFVNKSIWDPALKDHTGLVYLLLASCGLGQKQFHEWIKAPTRKTGGKIFEFLRDYYPTANNEELKYFLDINSADDFIELAKELGYQNDEIRDLKKELKKVK